MGLGNERDIHRIGGGSVDNLRLKPSEAKLDPPGISVLKSPSAGDAADQTRTAFPGATKLSQLAETVGSTNKGLIEHAGFQLMPNPTNRFPNHHRIIHPDGLAGFSDANLTGLSNAFVNTTGH